MASDTGSAPHPAAPRPAARRFLSRALLAIAALLLAICVGLVWLLQSDRGTQWLLLHAQGWSAGTLQITDVDGRLAGPLRIGKLTITLPDKTIVLQDVQLEWQPLALLHGRLHVNSLHVVKLALASKIRQSGKPMELPTDLGLPLKVQIDRMQVDGGEIAWGPMSLITLGSFASQLDYDGRRYLLNLERFSAQTHPGEQAFEGNISGTATLEATRPFSLQLALDSESSTSLHERTVSARAHLGLQGTLSDMQASLELRAGEATISGKAQLQPFADRPLGATDLQIRNLNLAELMPSLPATQLKAALHVDEQGAGQLTMTNAAAGLWNEQHLPLASLLLGFTQDRAQFRFERIDATAGTAQRPAGRILGAQL
jgi:translocation and assembly module TamB